MRLILILPKMHDSWCFFTGINVYHCEAVGGISVAFLGLGFAIEVFYK